MKADPKFSAGAREEREAFHRHFVRIHKKLTEGSVAKGVYEGMIAWTLERKKRYDKKPGGLGK
jgi:hypothetical protein